MEEHDQEVRRGRTEIVEEVLLRKDRERKD